jgi:hypothetical protein
VVDAGDRRQLLDRMRRLCDDAEAARLGAEAYRRYWDAPQTAEAHTRDLLAIYRTVLTQHAVPLQAIASPAVP